MTTIIGLQRRLREAGRIRIGQQVATDRGTRPAKLDTFRLTSRDRTLIDAASERWGGAVEPWQSPDGEQWQVTTLTDELGIVLPPTGMAFSQSYEVWSAGGCKRRCDGEHESISDKDCLCDPDNRECSIHTRLSVILPDLPGLGLWRLDTSGWYAATELAGTVELLQNAGINRPVEARLRLEQRSVKRPDSRDPSKVVTLRYAVPALDLGSWGALMAAAGGALPTGNLKPVPALPAPVQSIAEQVAAVQDQKLKPRANSAVPIPATGLDLPGVTHVAPRLDSVMTQAALSVVPEIDTLDDDERTSLKAWWKGLGLPSLTSDGFTDDHATVVVAKVFAIVNERPFTDDQPYDDPDTAAGVRAARPPVTARDLGILARAVFDADYNSAPKGQKTRVLDRLRHAVIYATVGKRSATDCTEGELLTVFTRLEDIRDGHMREEGWTWRLDADGVFFYHGETTTYVAWEMLEPGDTP